MNKQKFSPILIHVIISKFLKFKESTRYTKFKVILNGLFFLSSILNAQSAKSDNMKLLDYHVIKNHGAFTVEYIEGVIKDVFQYQLTDSAVVFIERLLENDNYYSYEEIYKFLHDRELPIFNDIKRFDEIINPEKSLRRSLKTKEESYQASAILSESMKLLQIQSIPTDPNSEELYEITTLLDSLSSDPESMHKIAQGMHHILSETTLIDEQNSLLREIYIERRLQLYIESLNGEQKSEFIAILYEKILPFSMKNMLKQEISNRNLTHDSGSQMIEFIETYISIYKRLFSFKSYFINFSNDQSAIVPLKGFKDLKISSVTLDDMSSFLELLYNQNSEDTFIKITAQKIVYLILNTTAFLNKNDPLYSIFYDHLNTFYMSLSQENKIQLMRNLAEEINKKIEISPCFKSILEKEAQNPLLSLNDYIKIFSERITTFYSSHTDLYRKDFINNEIKETGSFVQLRSFYEMSPYHVLSIGINLTSHQMHRAAKQLNNLLLNSYITKFERPLNLLSQFNENLSPDEDLQFKKLLIQEMIESVDLSHEFTRFLNQEKLNPKLSIKQYFDIYKYLIQRYHSPEIRSHINVENFPFDGDSLELDINPEYHITADKIMEIKNLLESNPEFKGLSTSDVIQRVYVFLTKSDFLSVTDKATYEYFFNRPFHIYYKKRVAKLSQLIQLDTEGSLRLCHEEGFQRELIHIYHIQSLIKNYKLGIQNSEYSHQLRETSQDVDKDRTHTLKTLVSDDWLEISSLLTSNTAQSDIIEKIIHLGFYTDFRFIDDIAIKNMFFYKPFRAYVNNNIKTEQDDREFKRLFILKLNEKLTQVKGLEILKDILKNELEIKNHFRSRDCITFFRAIMEEISK